MNTGIFNLVGSDQKVDHAGSVSVTIINFQESVQLPQFLPVGSDFIAGIVVETDDEKFSIEKILPFFEDNVITKTNIKLSYDKEKKIFWTTEILPFALVPGLRYKINTTKPGKMTIFHMFTQNDIRHRTIRENGLTMPPFLTRKIAPNYTPTEYEEYIRFTKPLLENLFGDPADITEKLLGFTPPSLVPYKKMVNIYENNGNYVNMIRSYGNFMIGNICITLLDEQKNVITERLPIDLSLHGIDVYLVDDLVTEKLTSSKAKKHSYYIIYVPGNLYYRNVIGNVGMFGGRISEAFLQIPDNNVKFVQVETYHYDL